MGRLATSPWSHSQSTEKHKWKDTQVEETHNHLFNLTNILWSTDIVTGENWKKMN